MHLDPKGSAMRLIHQTHLSSQFTIRYWSVVAVVLGVPIVLIAAIEAGRGGSPLAGLALPWMLVVAVAGLIAWRWSAHRIEITEDAVTERCHPLVLYQRRRGLDEIAEVATCPPERRGLEHDASALLLRCARPHRDLVVAPANPQQFLDDLRAADPSFERYRGRIVRRGVGAAR
jgi:hypothetical protein